MQSPRSCYSGGATSPPSVARPGSQQQSQTRQRGVSATTCSARLMVSIKAEHIPRASGSASPAPKLTATDSSSTCQIQAVIFWHFTSQNDKVLSIKCSPIARTCTTPGVTPTLLQHATGQPSPRTGHHGPGNHRNTRDPCKSCAKAPSAAPWLGLPRGALLPTPCPALPRLAPRYLPAPRAQHCWAPAWIQQP